MLTKIGFFVLLLLVISIGIPVWYFKSHGPQIKATQWEIQSIDTMKISRDLAREKETDSSFATTIDAQVKLISETGATHISIATPYDDEFLSYLTTWVTTARKYHLNVWFRGNLSGWEGWFDYQRIDRPTHSQKIQTFIETHPELFADGDIFSSCPECENGGPGDPRTTGDIKGYRKFLIDEYTVTKAAFN